MSKSRLFCNLLDILRRGGAVQAFEAPVEVADVVETYRVRDFGNTVRTVDKQLFCNKHAVAVGILHYGKTAKLLKYLH